MQRQPDELRTKRAGLSDLRRRARQGPLTLVCSARDVEHNNAVVLLEVLRRGLPSRERLDNASSGQPTDRLRSAM